MSGVPDPRLTLARPDLAARDLEGVVRAARFADTLPMQIAVPVAALRTAADPSSEQADQVLFGERFDVLEVKDGRAWGQARRDGYVGFVEAASLTPEANAPTHWVCALRAFAFESPSIKSRATGPFSVNALVAVVAKEGDFLHAEGAGWFHGRHLRVLGDVETDFVAVAESLLGAPYLWGGRDSLGVDCSGLVQLALYACGRACPRDTDQQAQMGVDVAPDALARGDLVFWRGHMGVMADPATLLHANAFHMRVAAEPLKEAVARIASGPTGAPTAYRRLGVSPGN